MKSTPNALRTAILIGAIPVLFGIGQSESLGQSAEGLTVAVDASGDRIEVRRSGGSQPILTQVAESRFRPYLHPIVAPDGRGLLTEFSPGHHKHQTGLYWGFTRVNGRDYFHNPGANYWKRISASVLKASAVGPTDSIQWQTVYELLGNDGKSILRESQIWTMRDEGQRYQLDLQWTGEALTDITIGKYDYGGLFVRMPWRAGIQGEVVNSARQRDSRAEGQQAISILDHPQNGGFPQSWRVDSQMGVGPVRARSGDWAIVRGQQETIRHRLLVYAGSLSDVDITRRWSDFTGLAQDSIQWQLAQKQGRKAEFLTPEKAVASMTLKAGFQANVFAAEPMIGQPMAFCWDAKGRIWIAENRDYETRQTGFANDGSSRVVILEDTDRDGVADNRKVFCEGIPFPSAMAVGMGGLWLGAPPNLLWVPDSDGDDRADWDNIQVKLTGWGIRDRHETLNSLIWGPDGWLYGLQGFATPSKVGKPLGKGKLYRHGDKFPENIEFDGEPVDINGGVWRYHPTKGRFEVVAHGFSNPWGIDYDARGQLFITACVIPHLWHVIPGGIYHRQGGSHFNPHVYSDITTIADHKHQSAHGGARVYQSDAFPSEYHGRIFMANIHEHAVLTDVLEKKGSGFVGHHGDDFLLANNAQWIGFSMEVGPEGAVYVLDWHDADICGKEVLNKDTGRVFRIAPRQSQADNFENRYADLNAISDSALARLQNSPSVWHATQARTVLQHRSQSRAISKEALDGLHEALAPGQSQERRLRALWTLHVTGSLPPSRLLAGLQDADAYMRAWSIQLLCEDRAPQVEALQQMAEMAVNDPSPVVRLYLAAAAQRIPAAASWQLLERLSMHSEDSADHNIPKMLWFALEPLVTTDPLRALALAERCKIPMVTRFIARRIGDEGQFDLVIQKLDSAPVEQQLSMLLGIRDATEGRFDMAPPGAWAAVYPKLIQREGEIARVAIQLSQQFGDAQAARQMLKELSNRSAREEDRRHAIQTLAGRKRAELKTELVPLLDEAPLRREAIRAMSCFGDEVFAKELLARYAGFTAEEKQEAIQTLASRSNYGNLLTNAIAKGSVPKSDVPAHIARVLRRVVGNRFVDVWGPIDALGADKEALFEKYRELLSESALAQADPSQGRSVFSRNCAACHKLHGEGGSVGPDITGANRSNLEYLLSNILTPSAIIQDAYRMHMVLTDDGRVHSGIPVEENERYLKMRVANRDEPLSIPKAEIESQEIASVSMMPDGILVNLKDSEVIDLIRYLQSSQQVPLIKPVR